MHNLKTAREKFLFKSKEFESFLIDGITGERYGAFEFEFEDGDWQAQRKLLDISKGEITYEPALTTRVKDRYDMTILGAEKASGDYTGKYYIRTDKFSDKYQVYTYDPRTDSFSDQPVLAHPEFNISGLIRSTREQDAGEVIGFTYAGPRTETVWIDPEMKAIQAGLEQAYQGHNVSIRSTTPDRNRILFVVSSPTMAPSYFLLLDKSKVAVIGNERPWMDTDSLGEAGFEYATARDGQKIPMLITYPAGFEKGKDKARGAIIQPHGGPWARDFEGFDSFGWEQYFASRGFIVLRPQYRGSTGFGRQLWLSGDREWGQAMQDDKDDTAKWLVDQGYVDADKIAIHGYSYGGFAAMAAAVRPDGPYRCAIAGAGVSQLSVIKNDWSRGRIQKASQGNTLDGMDPFQNANKIDIPILIYHGDLDVRVPLKHSTAFYNRIKDRSPQSELVVIREMGHQSNKWTTENKAEVLENMERFLTTTCGM
ncbi:MAG: prolyl oligopeptidase family serine peptidase [Pseudomonadota bacterium]